MDLQNEKYESNLRYKKENHAPAKRMRSMAVTAGEVSASAFAEEK